MRMGFNSNEEFVEHAALGEAFVDSLLYDDSDELYHYGRKGMKWGQHIFGKVKSGAKQAAKKTTELAKAGYKKASTAHKIHKAEKKAKEVAKVAAKRAKITDWKKLSNEELKARIERLDMEKQYKELLKKTEPDYVSSGKKVLTNILESSVQNIGSQTVTYLMGRGVNTAFAKWMDDSAIINPKKGQKDK
jgi:hypothetical protein